MTGAESTKILPHCSQFYFKNGLVPYNHINVAKNLLLQSTSLEFVEWLQSNQLTIDTRHNTKELFEDFKSTYFGEESTFKQISFSKFIRTYAQGLGLEYKVSKSNGKSFFTLTKK